MQTRHVVAAVLLVALALIAWRLSATGEDQSRIRSQYSDGEPPPGASMAMIPAASSSAGALTTKTVRDAKLREEMRRRIAEAWSQSANGASDPDEAKHGQVDRRYAPMPERADGKIDPDYLRQRVKEDFLPMAKGCYNELLARDPKAAGKIIVKMKIVGDEKIGGIVEDATIDRDAGTLPDDKLETCFRESMMSMAFAPPPHGGSVTVIYPFTLASSDPDAPKEGGP